MNCVVCLDHVEEYIRCECGKAYCFGCWLASSKQDVCSCCKREFDFYQPTLSSANKRCFIHKLSDIYYAKRESKRNVYYKRGNAIINNLKRIETEAEKYGGHIDNKPYDKFNGIPLSYIHKAVMKMDQLLAKPNFKPKVESSFPFFNITDKEVGKTNLQAVQDMIIITKSSGIFCGGWSIPININDVTHALIEDAGAALKSLRLLPLAEEYAAYADYSSWNCKADRGKIIEYGKRVLLSDTKPVTCCDCGGVVRKVDGSTMKCDDCAKVFCMKCGKPFDSQHTCNKEDLEEWSEILKTTKPCPKCGFRFAKKEGTCNDAYCTCCDTGFRYDTGKLIKHPFENPERKAAIERRCKEEKLDVFTTMYELDSHDIEYEILEPLHIAGNWRSLIRYLIHTSRRSAKFDGQRFIVKKIKPHMLDLAVNLTRALGSMEERKYEEWGVSRTGRGGSLTDKDCKEIDKIFKSFIERLRMFGDVAYVIDQSIEILKPLKTMRIIDRFPETVKSLSYKSYQRIVNVNQVQRTQYYAMLEEIALDAIE